MAIAVKIFNISMHEKWRNSQCSQIRKDRDRATTQSTFLSYTHNMSQCCTISFVKHWHTHTDTHTQGHGHTLSTQLLTHVYACHIIKHIKHIMGRVCHRHAYTLQPHTHTCSHCVCVGKCLPVGQKKDRGWGREEQRVCLTLSVTCNYLSKHSVYLAASAAS